MASNSVSLHLATQRGGGGGDAVAGIGKKCGKNAEKMRKMRQKMPLECFLLNIIPRDLPRKCEKKAENAKKCEPHPPPPPGNGFLVYGPLHKHLRHQHSSKTKCVCNF